jgi:hypothetical protein
LHISAAPEPSRTVSVEIMMERREQNMTDPNDKPGRKQTDRPDASPDDRTASAAPLRGDLDAGHGRDKVNYPDPAAAPLGTDDEAAGTPITEEQLQMARAQEDRRDRVPETDPSRTAGGIGAISVTGADRRDGANTSPHPQTGDRSGMRGAVVAVIALIIVAVLLMVVFAPI